MAYEYGCGDLVPTPLSLIGAGGSAVPFFVTGTDPAVGVVTMSGLAGDFIPANLGAGGTFIINIETDAPIEVKLADGNDFTITQAQATAYLGQWYPALLLKVYKTGTLGTFSVGR